MITRTMHDREVDVFHIATDAQGVTSSDLKDDPGVVVDLTQEYGVCQITSLEVMGISAYLPLGKLGYDVNADTLTLGETVDHPEKVLGNGDLVVHWGEDKYVGFVPVGVVVSRASWHMGGMQPVDR